MYRVMVVDDEEGILRALKRELGTGAYEIETFTEPTVALQRARAADFDLVISDYRMPEMDGVTFLSELKKVQPDTARIILSGYSDFSAVMDGLNKAEIYRFVSKPWHERELKIVISQALQHYSMLLENRRLADQVRRQQAQLDRQRNTLERLERASPGITKVKRAEDGAILLDEENL